MELVSQLPDPTEVIQKLSDTDRERSDLNRSYTTSVNIGYIAGMGSGNPEQITDDGQIWYDC